MHAQTKLTKFPDGDAFEPIIQSPPPPAVNYSLTYPPSKFDKEWPLHPVSPIQQLLFISQLRLLTCIFEILPQTLIPKQEATLFLGKNQTN